KGIVDVESGISLSERNITTFYTQNLNYTNNNIQPFSRWYASFNGNAGMAVNAGQHWNMKFNISTGYRSPNLAELSSNGVHEGTFRYEIGNPSMKVEQNLNMEININYESKGADVYSAVFLNQFRRYIYLTPTGQQLYGFDIYRFLQNDALFQGGELSVSVRPAAAISFTSQFSTVTGKLKNGDYLPFIPANRWTNELVLKKVTAFRNTDVSWRTAVIAVSAQKHPGLFETGTDGYVLINTGFLFVLHRSAKDISLSLMAGNLLNKTYYDHLSRFKYFGIYNQGRNIHLSLSVPLSKKFI
ncbi:MAG: TonB-dependent receptor, partial [Flavisolibacter sp.]|nr:TonB-dependent receptor [Flavisolibacter sp.]